jgi:hypothetical protein
MPLADCTPPTEIGLGVKTEETNAFGFRKRRSAIDLSLKTAV